MTLPAEATATCPGCGSEFAAEVFASINVSVNPELKARVVDGSLFDHDCPKCGKLSRFVHDSLYHDMERRFQVWLRPEGDAPGFVLEPLGERYRLRWVEKRRQLAEKILVFDARLDDRLVELLKVWTLVGTEDMEKPLIFSRLDPSRDHVEFLTEGKEVVSVAFSKYQTLRQEFGPKLEPDSGWQKIDRQFALRVLGLAPRVVEQPAAGDTIGCALDLRQEQNAGVYYKWKRAQHDEIVRGTAIIAVVGGIITWIDQGKSAGFAVLGFWLFMALLFALYPPKPTDPD